MMSAAASRPGPEIVPNFNTDSGLTPICRGPGGERPGSAPGANPPGLPRASSPSLRGLFAPGTPAATAGVRGGSRGPGAAVDELVAPLGHPGLNPGGGVATAAAAELIADLGTEASIWSGTGAAFTGPDLEPAVVPTAGAVVQVLAAADRSKAFTASPPVGLVAGA